MELTRRQLRRLLMREAKAARRHGPDLGGVARQIARQDNERKRLIELVLSQNPDHMMLATELLDEMENEELEEWAGEEGDWFGERGTAPGRSKRGLPAD